MEPSPFSSSYNAYLQEYPKQFIPPKPPRAPPDEYIIPLPEKAKIVKRKSHYSVYGNGLNSFRIKKKITKLYIGNSMTTARLISGLCSTLPSKFYLYGDASANRRDFMRCIEKLERVGAKFFPRKKTLPLTIEGTSLHSHKNMWKLEEVAKLSQCFFLAPYQHLE